MFSESELISGHGIDHGIEKLIQKDFPEWDDYKQICKNDFHIYQAKYISSIIDEETGRVKELNDAVLHSITDNETIAENVNQSIKEKMKKALPISLKKLTPSQLPQKQKEPALRYNEKRQYVVFLRKKTCFAEKSEPLLIKARVLSTKERVTERKCSSENPDTLPAPENSGCNRRF